MMNERMRESLSALMDDEANELELERVLSRVAGDSELRLTWARYNLAQQVVHGHTLEQVGWDVSARVRESLQNTPAAPPASAVSTIRQRMMRPLTSVAVAASVTLMVVVGGQQFAQLNEGGLHRDDPAVAASASPVGLLNSFGATTVPASYGTLAAPALEPVTRNAYEELAKQRLRKYMQVHAEQAALNSPQGLVPFARVPELRE